MSETNDRPLVELEQVGRVYTGPTSSRHALCGVSLRICSGEFVCFKGPSGSGKTTLLNLIGLLDRPDSGKVRLENMETGGLGRRQCALLRRRLFGFIFQDFNLIGALNAKENVAWSLMLRGVGGCDLWRLTEKSLAAVGLAEASAQRPGQLSGGQQQRVAVARALATSAPIILADEPTASLDSATGSELLDLMRAIHRDRGTTFIFSSHDPAVITRANRVITLRDGKITADEKTC